MLYASSQRVGAFLERLAPFRPDPLVAAGASSIAGGGTGLAPGQLPLAWLTTQMVGAAVISGEYAYIGHSESLAFIRSSVASRLGQYGLAELDAATIRLSTPRRLTQEISRVVRGATAPTDAQFAGICYGSRLGDELENWAIFESGSASISPLAGSQIERDDPDLVRALQLLGIHLAR